MVWDRGAVEQVRAGEVTKRGKEVWEWLRKGVSF